jgi:hypothetical protein
MSEVIGKIIVIGNEEIVGSAGTFRKRLLVVETDEQYKQKIPIDFVQDKCSVLDKYTIGDTVKVGINIRGNEYNAKYYVSLNGWKIEKLEGSTAPILSPIIESKPNISSDSTDDLPF